VSEDGLEVAAREALQVELGEQRLGLLREPLVLGQDLGLESRGSCGHVGDAWRLHGHRPGPHRNLPRPLMSVAIASEAGAAGVALATQELPDLGFQSALEHSPGTLPGQPLKGRGDLSLGIVGDVILCVHRAFLHRMTGKVFREGTPLFVGDQGHPWPLDFHTS
jgi:hypothetical protein